MYVHSVVMGRRPDNEIILSCLVLSLSLSLSLSLCLSVCLCLSFICCQQIRWKYTISVCPSLMCFFFFFFFFFNTLKKIIYNCIVPMGFLPWAIRVVFPGKSQLQQSHATQPTVHAGCFSVSIIHQTLTWTTGSLTCAQMLNTCNCT